MNKGRYDKITHVWEKGIKYFIPECCGQEGDDRWESTSIGFFLVWPVVKL